MNNSVNFHAGHVLDDTGQFASGESNDAAPCLIHSNGDSSENSSGNLIPQKYNEVKMTSKLKVQFKIKANPYNVLLLNSKHESRVSAGHHDH